MLTFPGCVFYEPTDLGFNATAVGAGASVDGNIIATAAVVRITGLITLHLNASVAVTSLNVRINLFRETGQTPLLPANQNLWTAINVADAWLILSAVGPSATAGSGALAGIYPLFTWPYCRLNVNNSSAVPTNVTLRMAIGTQPADR